MVGTSFVNNEVFHSTVRPLGSLAFNENFQLPTQEFFLGSKSIFISPTSSLYHSTSTMESPNCVLENPYGGDFFKESAIFIAGGGCINNSTSPIFPGLETFIRIIAV